MRLLHQGIATVAYPAYIGNSFDAGDSACASCPASHPLRAGWWWKLFRVLQTRGKSAYGGLGVGNELA